MTEKATSWIPFTLAEPEEPVADAISSIPGWVTETQKHKYTTATSNDLFNEHAAINAELLKRAHDQGNPAKATPILVLAVIAGDSLAALGHLAIASNSLAGKWLSVVIRSAVKDLNSLSSQYPEVFENAFKGAPTWPVLHSPHPQLATNLEHLNGKLEHRDLNLIGNGGRKGKDLKALSTRLALRVYRCVWENRNRWLARESFRDLESTSPIWVKHCGELPDFNTDSVKSWAEVGWEILLFTYAGHPERDAELRTLRSDDRPNGIRNELLKALKRLCKTHGER